MDVKKILSLRSGCRAFPLHFDLYRINPYVEVKSRLSKKSVLKDKTFEPAFILVAANEFISATFPSSITVRCSDRNIQLEGRTDL